MKTWLTVEEAALLTQRSKWAIYKWVQRGKISTRKAPDGTMMIHARTLLDVESVTRPGRRPNTPSHNRRRCA